MGNVYVLNMLGSQLTYQIWRKETDHVTSPQARYNPGIFILRILEVKANSVIHESHFCRAVQNWAKSVEMENGKNAR